MLSRTSMMAVGLGLACFAGANAVLARVGRPDAACAKLAATTLPGVTVTVANVVSAAEFAPPAATVPGSAAASTPPRTFCRVALTLAPTSDSDIKVELWMPPAATWNRKFQAVGNGGFSGAINNAAMTTAINRGYATASTDTGHAGQGANFALVIRRR